MKQTSEAAFETAIESVLLDDGYCKLASGAFDTERAIFPGEALTFIRETQSKTWEKLEVLHGAAVAADSSRGDAPMNRHLPKIPFVSSCLRVSPSSFASSRLRVQNQTVEPPP